MSASSRAVYCILQAYPVGGTPAYIYNWENSGPAVALLLAKASNYAVRPCARPRGSNERAESILCRLVLLNTMFAQLSVARCWERMSAGAFILKGMYARRSKLTRVVACAGAAFACAEIGVVEFRLWDAAVGPGRRQHAQTSFLVLPHAILCVERLALQTTEAGSSADRTRRTVPTWTPS